MIISIHAGKAFKKNLKSILNKISKTQTKKIHLYFSKAFPFQANTHHA